MSADDKAPEGAGEPATESRLSVVGAAPKAEEPKARAPWSMIAGLLIELNVTPRWWAPSPHYFKDAADCLQALAEHEGTEKTLIIDVQVGQPGVRIVLIVPSGNPVEAFETTGYAFKAVLDGLDASSPRRQRATQARAAQAKAQAEQAAKMRADAEAAQAQAAEAVKQHANGTSTKVETTVELDAPPAN